jgi:hypothetical protein
MRHPLGAVGGATRDDRLTPIDLRGGEQGQPVVAHSRRVRCEAGIFSHSRPETVGLEDSAPPYPGNPDDVPSGFSRQPSSFNQRRLPPPPGRKTAEFGQAGSFIAGLHDTFAVTEPVGAVGALPIFRRPEGDAGQPGRRDR